MKKSVILASAVLIAGAGMAKKTLDHDCFDSWERLYNHSISNNGEWASFSVNPQEGDGTLTFYNTSNGRRVEIPRGYSPAFSADSRYAFALVKPLFKATRQAKIDKKKDFDLPQDSLAIVELSSGKVTKIADVISYKTGKDGGEWVAWLSCDTTLVKPAALKDKKAGRPLVVRHLSNGTSKTINWVDSYLFSNDGSKLAVTLKKEKNDSLATNGTGVVILPDTAFHLIDRDKLFYGVPRFNEAGTRLAYVASVDSAESGTRRSSLFMTDLTADLLSADEISLSIPQGSRKHLMKPHAKDPETQARLEKEWEKRMNAGELMINQYSEPVFSHDGRRVVIGVAPYVAPDDTTLVDFEKATLDIWRWDAPFTPPQENNQVDRLRKQTFPVVIDMASGSQTLLTSNPFVDVAAPDRWDADWALLTDATENISAVQWDYQFPVQLSIVNVNDGDVREVTMAKNELSELSPAGKYVMWFDDRQFHAYDIATGKTATISADVPYPLWNETMDFPLKELEPYGVMGWSENDGAVLVYDRYDVWSLDPKGERAPVCVTAGEGRKNNLRFRSVKTDPDFRSFKNGDKILYSVFDYAGKRNGLATSVYGAKTGAPKVDFLDEYSFTQVRKAKNAGVYSWDQANFSTSPNVYVSRDIEKGKAVKVTDTNPQMAEYNWGTAQLFKWYTYDGTPAEGVLYLPEDFSPDKEYPMISYFYETYTEDLYTHYDMEPSWSWINFPFYVSRGYVVFVPDIKYTAGVPGECAYNFVCSGVEELCKKYPNIDKSRVGIDGQSWGGYQTAYLVTRTDMFACAGSGAPVSNMTSAFGGIRWGTGDSRQAQYEVGQSRIGRNLWDAKELYLANSPVLYADRVETPLLIMSNDEDGAVPWYQGIEMFMALRRLGKPVWMLQYNGEAHNLKERRNRKDITRRLQQFFDHYLKGEPMPEWMKNGIPAIRKGQEYGF